MQGTFIFVAACAVAFASTACSSDSVTGTGEPLHLTGSRVQFFPGKLPGTPPPDPEAEQPRPPEPGDGGTEEDTLPVIINFTGPSTPFAGQTGIVWSGTASPNAASVGFQLDLGTGYWIVPTLEPDPQDLEPPFDETWSITADLQNDIAPGKHDLLVVAFDEKGNAGQQTLRTPCIASTVPDNFNYCRTSVEPPQAVISLYWDTPVDLDLQVMTPDGTFVSSKNPATLPPEGDKLPDEAGVLDVDANASCRNAGVRRENLVWQTVKPSGTYGLYANLFDACKQPDVHFVVQVFTIGDTDDGNQSLIKRYEASGTLLDFQANGGSARGLFINDFTFR